MCLFMWVVASHAFYVFLKICLSPSLLMHFSAQSSIVCGYQCLSTIFHIRPAFTEILRCHQEKLLLFWKSKTPSHLMEDALGWILLLFDLRLFKCSEGFLRDHGSTALDRMFFFCNHWGSEQCVSEWATFICRLYSFFSFCSSKMPKCTRGPTV